MPVFGCPVLDCRAGFCLAAPHPSFLRVRDFDFGGEISIRFVCNSSEPIICVIIKLPIRIDRAATSNVFVDNFTNFRSGFEYYLSKYIVDFFVEQIV